jgi:hypothetical protein
VPGVTSVIGLTRVNRVSSVAGMSGVVLGLRRVTGVRALISAAVLGVVAHVVKLPNIHECAPSSRPVTSGEVRGELRAVADEARGARIDLGTNVGQVNAGRG